MYKIAKLLVSVSAICFLLFTGQIHGKEYIVTLKEGEKPDDFGVQLQGKPYTALLETDAPHQLLQITCETKACVREWERDPRVKNVEENIEFQVNDVQYSWGLDRIDGILDRKIERTKFTGKNVLLFVIDTGVWGDHDEFQRGRVLRGIDFTLAKANEPGNTDCHGHGTHVASIAAGNKYGVANGTKIVPVKVLSCKGTGTTVWVLKGINYAANYKTSLRKVVNFSIGGPKSTSVNSAIDYLTKKGAVAVVAAGNANTDACVDSPGSASTAFTVASVGSWDQRSKFSNYGKCVQIFAPGERIVAASTDGKSATKQLSGTSMATPFSSGVAAILIEQFPELDSEKIKKKIIEWSLKDVVSDPQKSPNRLLKANNGPNGPTPRPTFASRLPTRLPTSRPTKQGKPTPRPTTLQPSKLPTNSPTKRPTRRTKTRRPTNPPPTINPTTVPPSSCAEKKFRCRKISGHFNCDLADNCIYKNRKCRYA